MGFKTGIVGLPNVGKSTLFNALTNAGAEAANFPFCTIDPNIGVVPVPDIRLQKLTSMVKPEKTVSAFIEVVDIAGLVKGASEGKGRGNAFLSHIREVDVILHVVRCFEDNNIMHVDGSVDAIRDINTIQDELVLRDLETIEKREEKLESQAKSGNKELRAELDIIKSLRDFIEKGNSARNFPIDESNEYIWKELFLLTSKPVLYVCNVLEEEIPDAKNNIQVESVKEYAGNFNDDVLIVCAKIESEIAELDGEEKELFLSELGLEQSGLDKLIQSAYAKLGLITYFTAGPKEVRAWTITDGTKAPQAAGKIHTDFEKGFIRAETIGYSEYVSAGSELAAKEAGKMRSEGKDYVMNDGDVVLFRFNV
ncbi:MAG: redox-regulated ATPase YchF [Thermodesulfobacteriota bacterium]